MKRIVIAGGTGFLGQCLIDYWKTTVTEIIVLTRTHQEDQNNVKFVKWDGKNMGYWANSLNGADVLINLNGKSVDCRYTTKNKALIYDTRLDSTYVLGEAIKTCEVPPKLWINAASATIYRHSLDKEMDEISGEIGTGFSVDVCRKWEQMFNSFKLPKTRQVIFRIGIVLGSKGGPINPLMNLSRLGFGGKHGRGNQYFSWIHESDFVRAFDFIFENEQLEDVFNLTVPEPIPNSYLMKKIRNVFGLKIGLPMPEWLLQIGAIFIQTETELILKSRRVVPKRLLDANFQFQFGNIEQALSDLKNKML